MKVCSLRVVLACGLWMSACSSGGVSAISDASTPDAGASDGAVSDSARADGGGVADAPQVKPGARRTFITKETFQGDLGGGSATGAERGDAACTTAAKAAQLGGAWKAWLSTSTVDAIDRIAEVGPWYDLAGTLIFADKSGLETSPSSALWLDEHGSGLPSDRIWTGTGFGGTYSPDLGPGSKPCGDWPPPRCRTARRSARSGAKTERRGLRMQEQPAISRRTSFAWSSRLRGSSRSHVGLNGKPRACPPAAFATPH